MIQRRPFPAPATSPEAAPFWEAAEQGRLVIPCCTGCGQPHWPPRGVCPFCMSTDIEWVPSEGRGKIYSYSVTGKPGEERAIAYVTLEEGPGVLTVIVDFEPGSLRIGSGVTAAWQEAEGGRRVLCFTPAPA